MCRSTEKDAVVGCGSAIVPWFLRLVQRPASLYNRTAIRRFAGNRKYLLASKQLLLTP